MTDSMTLNALKELVPEKHRGAVDLTFNEGRKYERRKIAEDLASALFTISEIAGHPFDGRKTTITIYGLLSEEDRRKILALMNEIDKSPVHKMEPES